MARKKKEVIPTIIKKAVSLIDCELEIIRMELEYPKRFAKRNVHKSCTSLKWTGSPIEFVELVYALYEAGSFGKTSLKTLFGSLGKMFGCEITNFYRLFWDIKGRTAENRTFFLNKLQKRLSEKLIRMDSGGRQ